MFNKIIDSAIANRLLVLLTLCVFIVTSVVVIPKLNLDAFPDVTNVKWLLIPKHQVWLPLKLSS
ncbi:MAG: cobalt-zinc-cadmium resistance protein CzcA [Pseudoalteromonas rhizosphaerae]|jgi:cobalt-zinc-cadmium resistance protein CzcA